MIWDHKLNLKRKKIRTLEYFCNIDINAYINFRANVFDILRAISFFNLNKKD